MRQSHEKIEGENYLHQAGDNRAIHDNHDNVVILGHPNWSREIAQKVAENMYNAEHIRATPQERKKYIEGIPKEIWDAQKKLAQLFGPIVSFFGSSTRSTYKHLSKDIDCVFNSMYTSTVKEKLETSQENDGFITDIEEETIKSTHGEDVCFRFYILVKGKKLKGELYGNGPIINEKGGFILSGIQKPGYNTKGKITEYSFYENGVEYSVSVLHHTDEDLLITNMIDEVDSFLLGVKECKFAQRVSTLLHQGYSMSKIIKDVENHSPHVHQDLLNPGRLEYIMKHKKIVIMTLGNIQQNLRNSEKSQDDIFTIIDEYQENFSNVLESIVH